MYTGINCRYGTASTHEQQAENEKRKRKRKRKREEALKSNIEPALHNTSIYYLDLSL